MNEIIFQHLAWGVNFGLNEIPETLTRGRIAKEIKLPGMARGQRAALKGVCMESDVAQQMRLQAERPGRTVHIIKKRMNNFNYYCIYCY